MNIDAVKRKAGCEHHVVVLHHKSGGAAGATEARHRTGRKGRLSMAEIKPYKYADPIALGIHNAPCNCGAFDRPHWTAVNREGIPLSPEHLMPPKARPHGAG